MQRSANAFLCILRFLLAMLRFSSLRMFLSFAISLTACASIVIGAFLRDSFLQRGFGWLLIVIEAFSVLRSSWSIIRRTCLSISQSVASEAIGLFVLCPFQLIIILVISSTAPKGDTDNRLYNVLQAVATCSACLPYAVGLITIATLTVTAYDGNVWLRDIDACPSPFPLEVLFAYVCPCVASRFSATESLVPSQTPATGLRLIVCLPGCSCQSQERAISKSSVGPTAEVAIVNDSDVSHERRRPPVLAQSLIRIPNAAERRSTITVDLPFEEYF